MDILAVGLGPEGSGSLVADGLAGEDVPIGVAAVRRALSVRSRWTRTP
jgi:hypothetical protein